MKPLSIDLFCGLGGWTEGLLEAGYRVIGFDIERHVYETSDYMNGERIERVIQQYPAQLVIQDVLTIHGSQFRNADLIVASPPCQEFSYMAMPWSRAKQIAAALRGPLGARKSRFDPAAVPVARDEEFPKGYKGSRTIDELNALFNACFRIQREASEAAGRHIPMVVENVRGAQPWVGKARASYGSFYLWGDVPALMPVPHKARKVPGFRFDGSGGSFQTASVALGDGVKAGDRNKGRANGGHEWTTGFDAHEGVKVGMPSWRHPSDPRHVPGLGFNTHADRATKNKGGSWFAVANNTTSGHSKNPVHEAVKQAGISGPRENGKGDAWFQDGAAKHGSKSSARKAASARIAKIPTRLGRYIANYYRTEVAA